MGNSYCRLNCPSSRTVRPKLHVNCSLIVSFNQTYCLSKMISFTTLFPTSIAVRPFISVDFVTGSDFIFSQVYFYTPLCWLQFQEPIVDLVQIEIVD